MPELEKVIKALEECYPFGTCEKEECPYYHDAACLETLHNDALAVIKSLQEDIEVWKKRYKYVVIECKSADDPNKEPDIVKAFTTEEVQEFHPKAFREGIKNA